MQMADLYLEYLNFWIIDLYIDHGKCNVETENWSNFFNILAILEYLCYVYCIYYVKFQGCGEYVIQGYLWQSWNTM